MSEPIDIILVTFKRLSLLKVSIRKFYERTRYLHRILVVNNAIDDIATIKYLTFAKNCGYIHDFISLPENKGLANAFTEGFNYFKKTKEGISEYLVTTQDDVVPALLRPECWLERLLNLFKKYENEYGAISCRTQRIRRRDVDEEKELIDSPTSLASFNRIQRSDDIEKAGGFSSRPHWESPVIAEKMKMLKKKLAVATHIYCEDTGFMVMNKGYSENFTNYKTYSKERVNQGELQPYPDIDEETCIPMKINNLRDMSEHEKRLAFWKLYGFDAESLILAKKILKHKGAIGKYKNWEEYWQSEDGEAMRKEFFTKDN